MYSLVRFLKAAPFSYYFCKQCECRLLHWTFSNYKNCDGCGHANCSHFGWWNREILRPIQRHGPTGEGQVAFDHLRQLLRCAHCVRVCVVLRGGVGWGGKEELEESVLTDTHTQTHTDTETHALSMCLYLSVCLSVCLCLCVSLPSLFSPSLLPVSLSSLFPPCLLSSLSFLPLSSLPPLCLQLAHASPDKD